MKTINALFPKRFTQIFIPAQIVVGVVAALLEYFGFAYLFCYTLKLPLFMDCVFTITVSFFGPVAGIICGTGFHIISFFVHQSELPALFYSICSLTVVLIVRIFISKKNDYEVNFFRLCVMDFICILAISIEGGIIYTFITQVFNYREVSSINSFFSALLLNGVPFFFSSILGRIGINFLDKTISFMLAVLFAFGFEKIFCRWGKKSKSDVDSRNWGGGIIDESCNNRRPQSPSARNEKFFGVRRIYSFANVRQP